MKRLNNTTVNFLVVFLSLMGAFTHTAINQLSKAAPSHETDVSGSQIISSLATRKGKVVKSSEELFLKYSEGGQTAFITIEDLVITTNPNLAGIYAQVISERQTDYFLPAIGLLEISPLAYEPIPVPGALWLFGAGIVGLVAVARRNNKRHLLT